MGAGKFSVITMDRIKTQVWIWNFGQSAPAVFQVSLEGENYNIFYKRGGFPNGQIRNQENKHRSEIRSESY